MSVEFTPPPEIRQKRASTKWAAIAAQLRSKPGEWAQLPGDFDQGVADRIKSGRYRSMPTGDFDATHRAAGEGRFHVWARFIGDPDHPQRTDRRSGTEGSDGGELPCLTEQPDGLVTRKDAAELLDLTTDGLAAKMCLHPELWPEAVALLKTPGKRGRWVKLWPADQILQASGRERTMQALRASDAATRDELARAAGFDDWEAGIRGTADLTVLEAAARLGVYRSTVRRWRARLGADPSFE